MSNKFNFFVESSISDDIYKAATKSKEGRYDNMVIFGRATHSAVDRQGESLEPSGFILDDFLSSGLVNLEHFYIRKGDPDALIGHPIEAYVKDNEFFVKAKLWKGKKSAEKLWDTLLAMKENNVPRRLGWSIEGNKLETDPSNKKRITKAKINHIALTFSPVGHNTYADISKGQQSDDYIQSAFSKEETEGGEYILQYEESGKIITVNKDFSVSIKPKAITTDSMKPLISESLEGDIKWNVILKAIKDGIIKKCDIPKIIDKMKNKYPLKKG